MSRKVTRRNFTTGLIAAMTLPCVASPQAARETRRFGVFLLFAPQRLLLESTRPLLLHLDRQLILITSEAPATAIQFAGNGRLQIIANRMMYVASSVYVTSDAGEAVPFVISVPPSSLHGAIRRQFVGTLEVQKTSRALQPVIAIEIESATASIVQAESPAHAATTYLRAQAIVSRSFLLAAATNHRGFDFCDTTHCQFLRELPLPDSPAAVATRETEGKRLIYSGATLAAMYSRSCGGHTRTLADLGLPVTGYPYYAVVCEPCIHNPERWSRAAGSQSHLTERDRLANNRIHGWSALPSGVFTRTVDGIAGLGVGHGLGLCQRGAAAMAADGWEHRQILNHYYPNTVMS